MKKISIIIPCYNEQKTLGIYYETMNDIMLSLSTIYDYEFIFIDDGSKDETLKIIKKLSILDTHIHYVSFSRNFGKESAIFAGLDASTGDYIVTMDVDLQDPPALFPKMLEIIEEGEYDSVGTRRINRKGEPIIRSLFARLFYKLISQISNIEIVDGARDYRLMTRQFVTSLLSMKEYNRFSKGLFGWIGYKTKWLEFENVERINGESKWSFF
jgi:glycosyltransferase involved in cell wall biosynthesis